MAPVAELTDRISGKIQGSTVAIPPYLSNRYWWAYMKPWAVWIFDRQWVVNVLLYGHYAKLRDAAFAEFASTLSGRTLQISCCYGDFTPRLTAQIEKARGRIDVVDILPVQLENVQRKIGNAPCAHFHRMDAEALKFPDSSFENVLVFFLLHEVPHESRERAIAEAFRVLKPGGTVVVIDFDEPSLWHPLRYLWLPFLGMLEPFARSLWRGELRASLESPTRNWKRDSYFGGLFQRLVGRTVI
ncbi:MAG TPA: rhodoquinone biosynthesis methyltransferase RquA [Rhizomicrobium sp.]|nr:rhodoquinone biosynthesis methyltransferase RquA [Rhizomicrobium sp.]